MAGLQSQNISIATAAGPSRKVDRNYCIFCKCSSTPPPQDPHAPVFAFFSLTDCRHYACQPCALVHCDRTGHNIVCPSCQCVSRLSQSGKRNTSSSSKRKKQREVERVGLDDGVSSVASRRSHATPRSALKKDKKEDGTRRAASVRFVKEGRSQSPLTEEHVARLPVDPAFEEKKKHRTPTDEHSQTTRASEPGMGLFSLTAPKPQRRRSSSRKERHRSSSKERAAAGETKKKSPPRSQSAPVPDLPPSVLPPKEPFVPPPPLVLHTVEEEEEKAAAQEGKKEKKEGREATTEGAPSSLPTIADVDQEAVEGDELISVDVSISERRREDEDEEEESKSRRRRRSSLTEELSKELLNACVDSEAQDRAAIVDSHEHYLRQLEDLKEEELSHVRAYRPLENEFEVSPRTPSYKNSQFLDESVDPVSATSDEDSSRRSSVRKSTSKAERQSQQQQKKEEGEESAPRPHTTEESHVSSTAVVSAPTTEKKPFPKDPDTDKKEENKEKEGEKTAAAAAMDDGDDKLDLEVSPMDSEKTDSTKVSSASDREAARRRRQLQKKDADKDSEEKGAKRRTSSSSSGRRRKHSKEEREADTTAAENATKKEEKEEEGVGAPLEKEITPSSEVGQGENKDAATTAPPESAPLEAKKDDEKKTEEEKLLEKEETEKAQTAAETPLPPTDATATASSTEDQDKQDEKEANVNTESVPNKENTMNEGESNAPVNKTAETAIPTEKDESKEKRTSPTTTTTTAPPQEKEQGEKATPATTAAEEEVPIEKPSEETRNKESELAAPRDLKEVEESKPTVEAVTTTTHKRVFGGSRWNTILTDHAEELEEAFLLDCMVGCDIRRSEIKDLQFALGSLIATVAIQHPSTVSADSIDRQLHAYPFPSVMKLYDHSIERAEENQKPTTNNTNTVTVPEEDSTQPTHSSVLSSLLEPTEEDLALAERFRQRAREFQEREYERQRRNVVDEEEVERETLDCMEAMIRSQWRKTQKELHQHHLRQELLEEELQTEARDSQYTQQAAKERAIRQRENLWQEEEQARRLLENEELSARAHLAARERALRVEAASEEADRLQEERNHLRRQRETMRLLQEVVREEPLKRRLLKRQEEHERESIVLERESERSTLLLVAYDQDRRAASVAEEHHRSALRRQEWLLLEDLQREEDEGRFALKEAERDARRALRTWSSYQLQLLLGQSLLLDHTVLADTTTSRQGSPSVMQPVEDSTLQAQSAAVPARQFVSPSVQSYWHEDPEVVQRLREREIAKEEEVLEAQRRLREAQRRLEEEAAVRERAERERRVAAEEAARLLEESEKKAAERLAKTRELIEEEYQAKLQQREHLIQIKEEEKERLAAEKQKALDAAQEDFREALRRTKKEAEEARKHAAEVMQLAEERQRQWRESEARQEEHYIAVRESSQQRMEELLLKREEDLQLLLSRQTPLHVILEQQQRQQEQYLEQIMRQYHEVNTNIIHHYHQLQYPVAVASQPPQQHNANITVAQVPPPSSSSHARPPQGEDTEEVTQDQTTLPVPSTHLSIENDFDETEQEEEESHSAPAQAHTDDGGLPITREEFQGFTERIVQTAIREAVREILQARQDSTFLTEAAQQNYNHSNERWNRRRDYRDRMAAEEREQQEQLSSVSMEVSQESRPSAARRVLWKDADTSMTNIEDSAQHYGTVYAARPPSPVDNATNTSLPNPRRRQSESLLSNAQAVESPGRSKRQGVEEEDNNLPSPVLPVNSSQRYFDESFAEREFHPMGTTSSSQTPYPYNYDNFGKDSVRRNYYYVLRRQSKTLLQQQQQQLLQKQQQQQEESPFAPSNTNNNNNKDAGQREASHPYVGPYRIEISPPHRSQTREDEEARNDMIHPNNNNNNNERSAESGAPTDLSHPPQEEESMSSVLPGNSLICNKCYRNDITSPCWSCGTLVCRKCGVNRPVRRGSSTAPPVQLCCKAHHRAMVRQFQKLKRQAAQENHNNKRPIVEAYEEDEEEEEEEVYYNEEQPQQRRQPIGVPVEGRYSKNNYNNYYTENNNNNAWNQNRSPPPRRAGPPPVQRQLLSEEENRYYYGNRNPVYPEQQQQQQQDEEGQYYQPIHADDYYYNPTHADPRLRPTTPSAAAVYVAPEPRKSTSATQTNDIQNMATQTSSPVSNSSNQNFNNNNNNNNNNLSRSGYPSTVHSLNHQNNNKSRYTENDSQERIPFGEQENEEEDDAQWKIHNNNNNDNNNNNNNSVSQKRLQESPMETYASGNNLYNNNNNKSISFIAEEQLSEEPKTEKKKFGAFFVPIGETNSQGEVSPPKRKKPPTPVNYVRHDHPKHETTSKAKRSHSSPHHHKQQQQNANTIRHPRRAFNLSPPGGNNKNNKRRKASPEEVLHHTYGYPTVARPTTASRCRRATAGGEEEAPYGSLSEGKDTPYVYYYTPSSRKASPTHHPTTTAAKKKKGNTNTPAKDTLLDYNRPYIDARGVIQTPPKRQTSAKNNHHNHNNNNNRNTNPSTKKSVPKDRPRSSPSPASKQQRPLVPHPSRPQRYSPSSSSAATTTTAPSSSTADPHQVERLAELLPPDLRERYNNMIRRYAGKERPTTTNIPNRNEATPNVARRRGPYDALEEEDHHHHNNKNKKKQPSPSARQKDRQPALPNAPPTLDELDHRLQQLRQREKKQIHKDNVTRLKEYAPSRYDSGPAPVLYYRPMPPYATNNNNNNNNNSPPHDYFNPNNSYGVFYDSPYTASRYQLS